MKKIAKTYLELCKVRISLFSALSSMTGFVLAASEFGAEMFVVMVGAFALACGSSALNQYQERDADALMQRTMKRPIPSGRVSPSRALSFSLMLMVLGLTILLLTGRISVALIGLLAVVWYNGVYTFLKRRTAFALIPGALVGTMPPAIGWVAAGGTPLHPGLLALCFFFFMWQVPHFWLLVLNYGKEYERAGFPSLIRVFAREQLLRIVFHWIIATAVSCLFISLHGIIHTPLVNILLFGASLWLISNAIKLLRPKESIPYPLTFRKINVYMLLVMALLSADKLLM